MINETRQKSVNLLHRKYEHEPDHAKQVRKLALLIFDKTKDVLHNFSDNERDLLEAGAFLHDIGYYISEDNHNKHSLALIAQEKLQGFTKEETEIIGNIARYHRGKIPQKSHNAYMNLSNKESKKLVKKLGGIVRLADGLDRSHLSIVDNLDCIHDSFSQILYIIMKLSIPDCSLEIWAADKKKGLFEEEFNIQVVFKVV